MTWQSWIAEVQAIARERGLVLTTTYVNSRWVSFSWRAANYSRFGSSGAGEEFIYLTSPAQFTWDWYGLPDRVTPPPPPPPPVPANPWERNGRFVPRVPAMAVSAALQALFKTRI